ncbi:MAG: protein TolR [Alphaproteobacteria bacterium]|nr:protein TolR [Alphaproteobacteria bacterium]MDP7191387.1 protein TolR [Alphaproteobacteria bacterium]
MKSQPGLGMRRVFPPMSEINVTPMVDVMLVLLVIFMVTAPLLTVGVPVDLPKTKAAVLTEAEEPLVISLNAEGKIFLQETETDLDGLVPRLQAITENKADTRIFVRGDKAIAYGRVMELMGRVASAGFSRVALIAENPLSAPTWKGRKGRKGKER